MIFSTSYNTTACKGYRLPELEIKNDYQMGNVKPIEASVHAYELGTDSTCPAFYHPYAFENKAAMTTVVDTRRCYSTSGYMGQSRIKNITAYNELLSLGSLQDIWLNDLKSRLKDFSPIPMELYSRWLSSVVAKRYHLDPLQHNDLTILSAIFYISLFTESPEDLDVDRCAAQVARCTNIKASRVFEVMDMYTLPMTDIHSFCANVTQVLGVRMNDFKPGMLFALLGGSWWGDNSRENIAVSLEFPPRFISLTIEALTNVSYKKTLLGQTAAAIFAKHQGNELSQAFRALISQR